MIDQAAVTNLIQQQINDAVQHHVSSLLADPAWIDHIEQRVLQLLQAKIEARFNNVSQDTVLNQTIQSALKSLLDRGFLPEISRYVDSDRFRQGIDAGLYSAISDVIENLSLDANWLAKVETQLNQQMHVKVNRYLSQLDLSSLISNHIDSALVRYFDDHQLVRTPGIDDRAANIELTVMDGVVVVERDLATTDLAVAGSATIDQHLQVANLTVTENLTASTKALQELTDQVAADTMTRMHGQWKDTLIDEISTNIRDKGIDIQNATVNGLPLIVNGGLAPGIRSSGLTQVGVLDNLEVKGSTNIAGSLQAAAVSIGSEEISMTIGMPTPTTAHIGVGPGGTLSLGNSNKVGLEISPDNLVKIDQLQINTNRIGFAALVPGYSGIKGDIVFNTEPGAGKAFAWVCLGAYSWQSLKSS